MITNFIHKDIEDRVFESSNTFMVIGAFDGIGHDYFFDKIISRNNKSIGQIVFVEPIYKWFLSLKQNSLLLKGKYDVQCYNVAVSNVDSEVTIATPKNGLQNKYGPYIDECSCIVEENNYYSSVISNMESNDIDYEKVKSVTFNTLKDMSGIKSIDYLKIDTEGHDLIILNSIDFNENKINYIKFEIQHIDKIDLNIFLEKISEKYLIDISDDDCFLIRKDYYDQLNNFNENKYDYDENIFTIENYMRSDVGLSNSIRILNLISTFGHNNIFVDLGVWHGFTSNILLCNSKNNNNVVYGVDVNFENTDKYVLSHKNYIKTVGDSVTIGKKWNKGPVGILFIDTLHVYEQVLMELYFWYNHIKTDGYIILHDTNWPEEQYDSYGDIIWEKPATAIKKFFNIDSLNYEDEFIRVENHPESNGMTFIKIKNKKQYGTNIDWVEVSKRRNYLVSLFNYYYDPEFEIEREILKL